MRMVPAVGQVGQRPRAQHREKGEGRQEVAKVGLLLENYDEEENQESQAQPPRRRLPPQEGKEHHRQEQQPLPPRGATRAFDVATACDQHLIHAPWFQRRVVGRIVERGRRVEERRMEQRIHERKDRIAGAHPCVGIRPRGHDRGGNHDEPRCAIEWVGTTRLPGEMARVQQQRREPDDACELGLHGARGGPCQCRKRCGRSRLPVVEREIECAHQECELRGFAEERTRDQEGERRRDQKYDAGEGDLASGVLARQQVHELRRDGAIGEIDQPRSGFATEHVRCRKAMVGT